MRSIAIAISLTAALIGGSALANEDACGQMKAEFQSSCGSNAPIYNSRGAILMGASCGAILIAIQRCEAQQRSSADEEGNAEDDTASSTGDDN
jgi:hypothetical protein